MRRSPGSCAFRSRTWARACTAPSRSSERPAMTEADVLTAIDDALQRGAVTEDEAIAREIQELALMLQADAPEPAPAFSEALGERVEAGFAKPPSSRRRLS